MTKVLEIFGQSTGAAGIRWSDVHRRTWCPFLNRLCLKNRKSRPDLLIGTCLVAHGKSRDAACICPHRLLERRQIFTDCIRLLTLHEPGNEFHVIPELPVPGGSVDYALVSVRRGKVIDFAGIELQALDTTGTVWPERQRFLRTVGIRVDPKDAASKKPFGINWKMSAKTILMQLHHKVETFEHLGKRLSLVMQNRLLQYLRREFRFDHLKESRLGDTMHIHGYSFEQHAAGWKIELTDRLSTDVQGVAQLLGLQVSAKVELSNILELLQDRISPDTLLAFGPVSDVTPVTDPS